MYFLRLAMLKPSVEEIAADAWEGAEVSLLWPRQDILAEAQSFR